MLSSAVGCDMGFTKLTDWENVMKSLDKGIGVRVEYVRLKTTELSLIIEPSYLSVTRS